MWESIADGWGGIGGLYVEGSDDYDTKPLSQGDGAVDDAFDRNRGIMK